MLLSEEFFKGSISPSLVFAGGFSFGGATAGAAISRKTNTGYRAAILIDGWYYIGFKKYGIDVDLPLELHERSSAPDVPCLFIGSEEFSNRKDLAAKTKKVQSLCRLKPEVHVLEGTRHGNFMDAGWWLPLARSLSLTGTADYHDTYIDIVRMMHAFLDKNRKSLE